MPAQSESPAELNSDAPAISGRPQSQTTAAARRTGPEILRIVQVGEIRGLELHRGRHWSEADRRSMAFGGDDMRFGMGRDGGQLFSSSQCRFTCMIPHRLGLPSLRNPGLWQSMARIG